MSDVYVIVGDGAGHAMAQKLLARLERIHMDVKQANEAVAAIAADVDQIKANDAAILTAVTVTQQGQQAKIADLQAMIDDLKTQVTDQPALLDAVAALKDKADAVKKDSDDTLAAVGSPVVVP